MKHGVDLMSGAMFKTDQDTHRFGNEEIEILYRKTQPPGVGAMREAYPPLLPSSTVEEHIRIERDVEVPLRDGTMIYTDIYRPEDASNIPAIVCWSPYGKRAGYAPNPPFTLRGVPAGTVSKMTKFEGLDPTYWCHHGYAIINPDARGSGNSQGDIVCFGTQEGQDGYDLIEWIAARDWSNGMIGMGGNSWLAMAQWYIAAEKPPHLACIAPWEGTSDIYREFVCWGGIPEIGFNNFLLERRCGPSRIEDYLAMAKKYPFMNGYWEDKVPRFENIEIPTYVTAGWLHFHLRGSFEGFRRIKSEKKWIRAHRDFEWPDLYTPENMKDLELFYDRYLKDIRNGWEMTPKVRLDVMDGGDVDFQHWRAEKEFPLARTQYQKLFLDGREGKLAKEPLGKESLVKYDAKDGLSYFTMQFDEDTELTGYMKLRLWVESDGADDMDLFVAVQKLDENGKQIPHLILGLPHPGCTGKLRVSMREKDENKSAAYQPFYKYQSEQRLKRGEIVPVEIEIWPTSIIWHAAQQIRVVVSGHYIREAGWFEAFEWDLRNTGSHIIHTGGKYDSHLLVPVIPPKYKAGVYIKR